MFSHHAGTALKYKETQDCLGFPKGIVISDEYKHTNSSACNTNAVEEEINYRKTSVPGLDLNLLQNTSTISSFSSSPASEIDDGKNNKNDNRYAHRRGENSTIPKETHDHSQEYAILRERIERVFFDQNYFSS